MRCRRSASPRRDWAALLDGYFAAARSRTSAAALSAHVRRLYTLLLYLALPLASLLVLVRGLREREYWRGWRERFGFGPPRAPAAACGCTRYRSVKCRPPRS